MTKLSLKSIGILTSVVALLSVEAAGRLAFRIFASAPGRRPGSEREREVLKQAAPKLARSRQSRLVIEGAVVAAFDFSELVKGKPRGKVLIVHGYRSRTEHMLAIAEALAEAGYQPVAIDMPGHGHSTGRQCHLPIAVEAIDAAWRQFDGFDAFVGHSFGGAAIMAAAVGGLQSAPARRPYKLVTIAAPTAMKPAFSWFARATGLSRQVKAAFYDQILKLTGKPLSSLDVTVELPGIRSEVLVFHAPDDKEVPFGCAEALDACGPHVRIKPIPGFGHRRILSAPKLLKELVGFLAPSGTVGIEESVANSRPTEDVICLEEPKAHRIA